MMAKAARSEDHEMILGPWEFELSTGSFPPEQRAFDIRIVESDSSTRRGMLPKIV